MNRAKIALDENKFRRLLNLPEEAELLGVSLVSDPPIVYVHVAAEGLPERIPGAEDYIIPASYFQQGKDAL